MTDFDEAMTVPKELMRDGYHYSWVTDDKKVMTIAQARQYETVKTSDEEGRKFVERNDPRVSKLDGTIRIGDAVLMRCRDEIVEKREKARRKRNREAVASVKQEYHETTQGLGVPTFEDVNP